MSRIGKQQISLPEKVELALEGTTLRVKGPLGKLERVWPAILTLTVTDGIATVAPERESLETKALWGTYAAHLKNMIMGVTKGYEKKLLIEGVGYRAAVAGQKMTLNLGLSHPVELMIPEGVKAVVDKGTITITGNDREVVGQFAAEIRALKKPGPYKGKGIRYELEVVRRKEGKKVVS